MPDGEAVQCAQGHDFEAFAQRELSARQSLGYPPFGRVVLLLFKGKDEHEVAHAAGVIAQALREQTPPDVEILGPVQAPLARIPGHLSLAGFAQVRFAQPSQCRGPAMPPRNLPPIDADLAV